MGLETEFGSKTDRAIIGRTSRSITGSAYGDDMFINTQVSSRRLPRVKPKKPFIDFLKKENSKYTRIRSRQHAASLGNDSMVFNMIAQMKDSLAYRDHI